MARRFYEMSKAFPKEERYSLTDQGRRSSRSIGSDCRAWAKRGYEKHFVSKLSDADGEQLETQHWMDVALDCGYLAQQKQDTLVNELERICRMLQSMKDKADLFGGASAGSVRETTAEYFTGRPVIGVSVIRDPVHP